MKFFPLIFSISSVTFFAASVEKIDHPIPQSEIQVNEDLIQDMILTVPLETSISSSDEIDDITCSICLNCVTDLEDRERVLRICPCGHAFHEGCIRQWIIDHARDTCPNCRNELRVTGKRENYFFSEQDIFTMWVFIGLIVLSLFGHYCKYGILGTPEVPGVVHPLKIIVTIIFFSLFIHWGSQIIRFGRIINVSFRYWSSIHVSGCPTRSIHFHATRVPF
jgi:hypothetical protein